MVVFFDHGIYKDMTPVALQLALRFFQNFVFQIVPIRLEDMHICFDLIIRPEELKVVCTHCFCLRSYRFDFFVGSEDRC